MLSLTVCQELFAKLSETAEAILAILISSDLSGTVDSALGAAANLPDLDIEVIDSRATSMMLGFPVLEAAKVADAGGSLEEVAARAREVATKSNIYFVVDTLEYLHRGGRIGGAAKLLGSALNLKPILALRGGFVTSIAKVRTRRKAGYAAGVHFTAGLIAQGAGNVGNEDRVHADGRETMLDRLGDDLVHLRPRGLGLKQSVVDL